MICPDPWPPRFLASPLPVIYFLIPLQLPHMSQTLSFLLITSYLKSQLHTCKSFNQIYCFCSFKPVQSKQKYLFYQQLQLFHFSTIHVFFFFCFLLSSLDFIQFINSLLLYFTPYAITLPRKSQIPICTNFTFFSSSYQQLDLTGENHRTLLTGLHLNCAINLKWELKTTQQKVTIFLKNSLYFPRRKCPIYSQ